jgi:hypothetical protein
MYHVPYEGSNKINAEGMLHLSKSHWPRLDNLWLSNHLIIRWKYDQPKWTKKYQSKYLAFFKKTKPLSFCYYLDKTSVTIEECISMLLSTWS